MEYFDLRTVLNPKVQKLLKMDRRKLKQEDKNRVDFFGEICKETDGKIPKEIGEMLVKENSNPDYTILIHRTSKRTKEECFEQGLPIAGGSDLDYTTSRYKDNMTLLINVRDAYGYKSGWGKEDDARCVIMKIPNTALEYIEGETKPILFQTDDIAEQGGGMGVVEELKQTVLLPEYILGTVEFEHGKMTQFVTNPNYTEIHDYKNDGLVCPDEVLWDYKIKKGLRGSDIKKDEINETIIEQNNRYREHPEEYEQYSDKGIKQEEHYPTKRTMDEIKQYSKKEMLLSKFNQMAMKIKNFFAKDKTKEENSQDVDKQ